MGRVVSVIFDDELYSWVAAFARRRHITVSDVIRIALSEFKERVEGDRE